MNIFELLRIKPEDIKVHLAVWNGNENPLDLFFDGTFKKWQEEQNKRNFQRRYILSLIRMDTDDTWLYAGIYESISVHEKTNGCYLYNTQLTNLYQSLIGRLIIKYKRIGRNSYPYGESIIDDASVFEVKPEPIAFSDFSDFREVKLTRNHLEILFRQEYPSWKSALSSVSGVYLISDTKTGKLYVGSAYGESGIWGRWSSYASSMHGNNKKLKQLYSDQGKDPFNHFQFSILETCDIDLSKEAVISIENRWKEKLLSKQFGYNDN